MSIFELLSKQKHLFPKNEGIGFNDRELSITHKKRNYLKVNNKEARLFEIDVLSKLKSDNNKSWDKFDSYFSFIGEINNRIMRLNHLGFGYKAQNANMELGEYEKHLGDGFQLVEEESGDKDNNRWFFIRHKEDRSIPKVELIFYFSDKYKDFCPQFQIDIDTDMSFAELNGVAEKHMGKDFFFWRYDVPAYGVVMAMGKIGMINGINILVGLGTNLRKSQTFMKI